jgi:hypothetical protein
MFRWLAVALLSALLLADYPAASTAGDRDFAEVWAECLEWRVPLVAYVGQDGPEVPGCKVIDCETFPGVDGPAVVIWLPTGQRIKLAGRPHVEQLLGIVFPAKGALVV